MHVVMIADFYWPLVGGVEQHVRTVSHELVRRGHRVTVLTLHVDDRPAEELDAGVEVIRVRGAAQRFRRLFQQSRPWAPPLPDPIVVRELRRIIRELEPDVLHGHDWLARAALAAGRRTTPYVSSLHYYTLTCAKKTLVRDDQPCDGPAALKCLACAGRHYGAVKGAVTVAGTAIGRRLERRRASMIIAVSSAAARGNGLDPGQRDLEVIPNCVSPHSSIARDGVHAELTDQLPAPGYFVFVGDFRRVKGVDVLLEAYAGLRTERPLVLIGKRWPESPASVPGGVLEFQNWPNEAVRSAIGRARALIAPSVWAEPFGIAAIEALAAGVPVVASATGGLVDIVESERNGLLVPAGSVLALRAAITRLDTDDALAEQLRRGAEATAGNFAAERVVAKIEGVYREVVAEHARGAGS